MCHSDRRSHQRCSINKAVLENLEYSPIFNPLMPGGNKKVTHNVGHTHINLRLFIKSISTSANSEIDNASSFCFVGNLCCALRKSIF